MNGSAEKVLMIIKLSSDDQLTILIDKSACLNA